MLHDILDMALDIPHISQLLARFVARAVIDGIIEKDYVESIQSKESAYLVKFKDYYEKLMIASKTTHNLKHCIWGITGSFMKNSELKTELINIAQSFIYRYNTITEIFQFIRDMRVPHYLHIFVFEITRLSIDSNYSKVILNSIYLLHEASRQLIINNTQICIGLQSAYEYYAQDKQISPAILNKLVYLLRNLYYKRIISNQLFNEFLTKGRSRFFSEKR
ncbi:hypothetical protein A3Q56_07419 [Intoshia linei]|uniref:MI domain-containing protein n=1 Tax=Intoshia linei TaxID=1819745 RepID=A0A177AU23_9BILA|nr:hypothetical protein A3Q56_07419 [Intoshia linei]